MIIPLAAALLVLAPALFGGRLSRLGAVRLRLVPLLLAAFVAQVLVISVLDGPETVLQAVHIATYGIGAVVLLANRSVPGLPVLGLGALANGVAISVNGGTLPASASALEAAGLTADAGFVNSGVLETPHLAFLGDVFAIPAAWPLSNVFSVGDVLIVAGAAYASFRICGTRWTTPWEPSQTCSPAGQEPGPLPSAA
jgi:hypothetical protein